MRAYGSRTAISATDYVAFCDDDMWSFMAIVEQPGEAAPLNLTCTHRKQFFPALRLLHEVLNKRVSALTALLPKYAP